MHKIFNSRKAVAVDDFIPILLTMLFFVFAMLFLFVGSCSRENTKTETVNLEVETIQATDYLLNYLQNSVDENKTMADLIITSEINKDYDKLERLTKDYFNTVYADLSFSWTLIINNQEILSDDLGIFTRELVAETTLPLPNNEIIEIKLYHLK
jgi:hypothetical protein